MFDPIKKQLAAPATMCVNRRQLLRYAGAGVALLLSPWGAVGAAAPHLVAVRIWPSAAYTRVTLESEQAIEFKYLELSNPPRLALDLHGVSLQGVLSTLPGKVLDDDPLVAKIRAADNRPGVVRVVFDLKTKIDPQVFTLKPIAQYGHRLVVDLYPENPPDPLLALIEQFSADKGSGKKGRDERAREHKRLYTIVIDAGHGGEDPGAVGRGGTYEKNVVLAIARRLQKKINSRKDMRSVLTRKGDYFVPLGKRVALARRAQADLFVSIHADAFVRPEAHGSSVYVLSEGGATSSAAKWLAKKENEADLIGGVNIARQGGHLARTLLDLSQTATINDSLKLGGAVLAKLGGVNKLHKPRVEQAAFAVLRAPDIPSILVETAFISNPKEEKRLKDKAYQDKMADAILAGIRQYIRANPGMGRVTVSDAGGAPVLFSGGRVV